MAGATLAPSTLSLIRNMFTDPHERTVAIGIWIASFSAGGAIAPLLGSVAAAVYRIRMVDAVPAGLAEAAAQATRATIGGAMAMAGQLPDVAGTALLAAARQAYVDGMVVATGISAAVMLATAVLALVTLGRIKSAGAGGY